MATQEAVNLYRALYDKQPEAFAPVLASSLNNLGHRLSNLGQHEAARPAWREACTLVLKHWVGDPYFWRDVLLKSGRELSAPADLREVHLSALAQMPQLRHSPLFDGPAGLMLVQTRDALVLDLWGKLKAASAEDPRLMDEALPVLVGAMQSPDLQDQVLTRLAHDGSVQGQALLRALQAYREALAQYQRLEQRLREYKAPPEPPAAPGSRTGPSAADPKLQALRAQRDEAAQQDRRARQTLQEAEAALAAVNPAFRAVYQAPSADALHELLQRLRAASLGQRASAQGTAALLCLLELPAPVGEEDAEAGSSLVGLLVVSTRGGQALKLKQVDFPGLAALAQRFQRYVPVGSRGAALRGQTTAQATTRTTTQTTTQGSAQAQALPELLGQLSQRWWQPLEQALGELCGAGWPDMLHVCTHGRGHHLPLASVQALADNANCALYQWPGLPYLLRAGAVENFEDTRATPQPQALGGAWQFGHDAAWGKPDWQALPMAPVEAHLLSELVAQAGQGVQRIEQPEHIEPGARGLGLCSHGAPASHQDSSVLLSQGRLAVLDVMQWQDAPRCVLLPVCYASDVADDHSGNAVGMAASFLLAGTQVVVGSSKPVPDELIVWFSTLMLWGHLRQGQTLRQAALQARAQLLKPQSHLGLPEGYVAWLQAHMGEALAHVLPGGSEHAQMQAGHQSRCAQASPKQRPPHPVDALRTAWPWSGAHPRALPGSRATAADPQALSELTRHLWQPDPAKHTPAKLAEMAHFIAVFGL